MKTALLSALLLSCLAGVAVGQQPANVIGIVNRVEFTGNTVVSTDELREVVQIEPGQLVTTAAVDRAIAAVEQAYRDRGYLAAVADDILAGLAETGTLTLPIVEVRVAEVRIEGLQETRPSAVRRLLELRPGDLYSLFTLRRDADRLHSLGVFESIDARIEQAEEPGQVIVVWQLREREKTGYISFGGSYGAEQNLVGSINLIESNFRNRLEQLRLSASIGSIGGRLSWELFYFNPWIVEDTSLTFRGFNAVRYRFARDLVNEPGSDRYFERSKGIQLVANRALTDISRLLLGVRYESLNVSNLPLEFMVPDVPSSDGNVIAVSGEYIVDRRDVFTYPTRGSYWRGEIEPGWVDPDDGGTDVIAKGSTEHRWFRPLDAVPDQTADGPPPRRPRVLALRLIGGTSIGDLPFFEQYFVGGIGSLRGYLQDRFWGKHMALARAEYRHPISRPLTALAFVDAGDAWGSDFQFLPDVDTDFRQHNGFSPRAGAGVGVRYSSLVGLLGLDFAWGEEFRTHLVIGREF